jgi:N-formylglutamate deformylase
MAIVEVSEGNSPVILGMPHTGTHVPPEIWVRLDGNGKLLADTDWHVHRLYEDLLPDVTTVRALFHRYVIDANRDPAGGSLYPDLNTTGLVPLTDFDGRPIWRAGSEPSAEEIAVRAKEFHAPYHAALFEQVERVRKLHGLAIIYDCHSIRSHIPFLFEGQLPDFNIGTDGGVTCDPAIEAVVMAAVQASGRTHVLNGRFRGGWTTRHYGQPSAGMHAIQMELAQSTHLQSETSPFAFDAAKASSIRETLGTILHAIDRWGRDHARG